MARSRKPSKANDKGKPSVESQENEGVVTPLETSDTTSKDVLQDEVKASDLKTPEADAHAVALSENVSDANMTADPLVDVPDGEQKTEVSATSDTSPDSPADETAEAIKAEEAAVRDEDLETSKPLMAEDGVVKAEDPKEALAEVDEDPKDDKSDADLAVKDSDDDTGQAPWGASETSDPAPEVEIEPIVAAKPPAPQIQVVKGSMWPALFGGIIAACIGFIVGRGDVIDQYLPQSMQRPAVDISGLEAKSADLALQLETLGAEQEVRIAALEAVSADDILGTVAALETDIEVIAERITTIETRPVAEAVEPGAPVEAVENLQSALAAQNAQIAALAERAEAVEPGAPVEAVENLKSALAAQNAQIAALAERAEAAEANAAGEAARILAQAALLRVMTAVDSGEAFDQALTNLEEVTPVEVPVPLKDAAVEGVPTLASLQAEFPDAARAALASARAEVPESEVVGITGFLKRQLNARSIAPREGDDPDAVLSRAQAAVSSGDLSTALTEIDALPDVARTAMNDWLEAATARKAVQDAANALADSLSSN